MKFFDRITRGDMHGVHYAVSMFIATALLWFLLRRMMDSNPIWAISSMVATSDPAMKQAVLILRSRVLYALMGCIVGLLVIAIGGPHVLGLPVAMAVTVLLSSYVIRVETMWRQAPISAAFVVSAGLQHESRLNGLIAGALRMSEVLFGCIVGIVVAWLVSVVWPLPDQTSQETTAAK
jgi:uncharacterized membrane protein YccC